MGSNKGINAQILEFTLSNQQSTNVLIGELSDNAYAHIDDDSFAVLMYTITPSATTASSEYFIAVQNNSEYPAVSSGYAVYGSGMRYTGTVAQYQAVFYPPNSTNNTTSLGGLGKFFHSGKSLYYKSAGYFLSAGTYRVVISW